MPVDRSRLHIRMVTSPFYMHIVRENFDSLVYLYCGIHVFSALWLILALVQFILTRRVFRVADSAAIRSRDRNNDEAMAQDNAGGNQSADEGMIT